MNTNPLPDPLPDALAGRSVDDAAAVSTVALGLTEDEALRVEAARTAALAPSTRSVYDSAWSRWERWATERGVPTLPADPAAVCAYLTERATHGVSAATIELACCAIGHRPPAPDPCPARPHLSPRPPAGPPRTAPHSRPRAPPPRPTPRRARHPPPRDHDRPHHQQGARDAAIILLGFASALRISELGHLTRDDLEFKATGVLLHLRRSKTDPEARGQVVGVAHGQHADTDPLAALDAWLTRRGAGPGPLFTSMRHTHRAGEVTLDPLSGAAIARMLRTRATAAGLPADRITGHSLRAGHATTAALAGVSIDRIAAQTHKKIGLLIERYIRPVEALTTTSSKDLGL